jgi:hypothetical protein
MPRATPSSLEARIAAIVNAAAAEIAAAVRQDMADQLRQLLDGSPFDAGRARIAAPAAKSVRSGAGNPGGRGVKRNVPKTCIVPGCGNPSKGPRWSFLCEKHLTTPKAERQKLLAAWKASQGGAPSDSATSAPRRGRKPKAVPAGT